MPSLVNNGKDAKTLEKGTFQHLHILNPVLDVVTDLHPGTVIADVKDDLGPNVMDFSYLQPAVMNPEVCVPLRQNTLKSRANVTGN
jgi:hypothetical protein